MITTKTNIDRWSQNANDFGEGFFKKYKNEGDFWRQKLINPNIISFMKEIKGKKVLDAGCGEGYFSRLIKNKGAMVTGLEPSDMIEYAVKYEQESPLGIEYLKEDLCDFDYRKEEFDYVVSINVFMDIPDYIGALKNCIASLKSGGKLIFSILHPCFVSIIKDKESGEYIMKWDYEENGYIKIEEYLREMQLKQANDVLTHRTLSTYINSLVGHGLQIKGIVEPKLDESYEVNTGKVNRDCHIPSFLIICAEK